MIHGGSTVGRDQSTYKVPKRDLVSVVQVLLQNRLLQVAKGPLREILVRELLNFKVKINPRRLTILIVHGVGTMMIWSYLWPWRLG